jgi:hypothetical protein
MTWTHIYDLLSKLAGIGIIVAVVVIGVERQGVLPIYQFCVAASVSIAIWYSVLRPFSSWCYGRISLKAPLTFAQSKRASALFSPLLNLAQWHPMRHVKDLPREERCLAIMSAADDLLAYHDARSREWRAAPLHAKILRVLLWSSILGIIVMTEMNLPPLSWVSQLQALVSGGRYLSIITIVVGCIPVGIAIAMLERRYGVRSVDPHTQALEESKKP